MAKTKYRNLMLSGLMVCAISGLVLLLPSQQYRSTIILFLVPVLVSSFYFGYREAVATSILSFIAIDFFFIEIDIGGFMRTIAADDSVKAARKGLTFEISMGKDVPEKIFTDRSKLQRILDDLLDNAIKFTAEGSVVVTVENCDNPIAHCLVFKVIDSGVGISDSAVQSVFEPFFKEELSHAKSREGIGLGLAHARKFAKALGGDVQLIRSSLGRGSTFEVKVAGDVQSSLSH